VFLFSDRKTEKLKLCWGWQPISHHFHSPTSTYSNVCEWKLLCRCLFFVSGVVVVVVVVVVVAVVVVAVV